MNKKMLGIVVVMSVASFGALIASTSELRSPLSLYRGPIHYPLDPVDDSLCSVDFWAGGYGRTAGKAYISCPSNCCSSSSNSCCTTPCSTTNCWCCHDKSTTNKQPLAALFFGKADFKGEEAFYGGMLAAGGVPALSFATISPRFDYNEGGAVFGIHIQKRWQDSNWHIGLRASLPVKRIEVEQSRGCGFEELEETLEDVIVRRQEGLPVGAPNDQVNVNAYRLDFLSTLLNPWVAGQPLLHYDDGTGVTSIAGIDITTAAHVTGPNTAPDYVMRVNDGKSTTLMSLQPPGYPRFGNLATASAPDGNLNAAGSNGADGQALKFVAATNYAAGLGSDRTAQGKLFLIPNAQGGGGNIIEPEANIIQNAIEFVLNQMDLSGRDSAVQFFKDHGVILCESEYIAGLGDLHTEIYAGYKCDNDFYLDAIFGVQFPTGKKNDCPKYVLRQPLGNNGHFEVKGALEAGWRSESWFAWRAYASYTGVLKRTEKKAPPFKGATIKNIPAGEPIDADVHWGYFLGNFDLNIFHPNNRDLGMVVGYELYAKQKDKVCLCKLRWPDFFDVEQELDSNILEYDTNTMTHKLRGEIFHRWDYCECFIGGSYVVAGRNAMRETELHLGVMIYF